MLGMCVCVFVSVCLYVCVCVWLYVRIFVGGSHCMVFHLV